MVLGRASSAHGSRACSPRPGTGAAAPSRSPATPGSGSPRCSSTPAPRRRPLAAAAEDRPLLAIVDDAQWLELQVALLVSQGMTNREAAAALFLSPKTIEYHRVQIYRKLEVRGRSQLARLMAMELPEGERPDVRPLAAEAQPRGARATLATPMAVLSAPRRRRPSVGGPLVLVAAVAVLLLALPALIPALNPFKEETVDRSGPVLLKSLEDLSEYRAASANLQVIVDVESDTELIPSFIKGERTLFVAAGSVDAAVDFRGLGKDPRAVRVSDDREAVAITLPAAHLTGARLDQARSRVYDRDRGALDRIEEALSDDGGADQQELYVLAERKLAEAARADPQILRTAEANTKQMLSGMLRALGFEKITITFARPPV